MGLNYVVASLVLHQLCQQLGDVWSDDDSRIHHVAISSKDSEVVDGVDEECYAFYDAPDGGINSHESHYYNLENTMVPVKATTSTVSNVSNVSNVPNTSSETINEPIQSSVYEKLKVVARKRRNYLVEIIYHLPMRSSSIDCYSL